MKICCRLAVSPRPVTVCGPAISSARTPSSWPPAVTLMLPGGSRDGPAPSSAAVRLKNETPTVWAPASAVNRASSLLADGEPPRPPGDRVKRSSRFAIETNVELALLTGTRSLQVDADRVLAVEREVVVDGESAGGAERELFAQPVVGDLER